MSKPRSPSLQKYLKRHNPQAKSAAIKEAVDMLENLKRTTGNPKAINAVGARELLSALTNVANFFKKQPRNQEEREEDETANTILQAQLGAITEQLQINATLNGGDPFIPGGTSAFVANLSPNSAPLSASYIVAEAHSTLTNERVLANSASVTWDYSVAGVVTASVSSVNVVAANTTTQGIVRLATNAETAARALDNVAVTPVSLDATFDDIDANIAQLQAIVNTLEANVNSAEAAIIDLQANVVQLQANVNTAEANIIDLQANVTQLQANVNTIEADFAAHIADTSDAHDASAISYAGAAGMSATDVEGAIDEIAGRTASLEGAPSASPGGSNTHVQFNDSTAFGGTAGFTFNKTTNNVGIANTLTVGGLASPTQFNREASADEGGAFTLQRPVTGSTLAGDLTFDLFQSSLRIFEGASPFKGVFLDISTCGSQSRLFHSAFSANTQVLFNDSTDAAGSAGFIFNKTTNNATIANTLIVAIANVTSMVNVGANVTLNTTALFIGNSTVNTHITANSILLNGTAVSRAGHVHAAGDITTGTMATARLGSGTANSTTVLYGDQTYKSGPGMVLLANGTVSAAATLDIVLTSYTAYRGFRLVLGGFLPATNAVDLWMRFSTNGGSSYDAGASDYNYAGNQIADGGTNANYGSAAAAQILLSRSVGTAQIGNATTKGCNYVIDMLNQTSTAFWTRLTYNGTYVNDQAGATGMFVHGSGMREAAQDTDAIRIMFSSGNITEGNWALYGYA